MLSRQDLSVVEKSSYGALYTLSFLGKEDLNQTDLVNIFRGVFTYNLHDSLKMVNSINTDRQLTQLLKTIEPVDCIFKCVLYAIWNKNFN